MAKFRLGAIRADMVPQRQYKVLRDNLQHLADALPEAASPNFARDILAYEHAIGEGLIADCLAFVGVANVESAGHVREYEFYFDPKAVGQRAKYRGRYAGPERGSVYDLVIQVDCRNGLVTGSKGRLRVAA